MHTLDCIWRCLGGWGGGCSLWLNCCMFINGVLQNATPWPVSIGRPDRCSAPLNLIHVKTPSAEVHTLHVSCLCCRG